MLVWVCSGLLVVLICLHLTCEDLSVCDAYDAGVHANQRLLLELCSALQGVESLVVEPHIEGATRVSVTVVEGSQGPVALLPSQEEVVCPETDFLDAHIAAQRKMAQAEVSHASQSMTQVLPSSNLSCL